MADEKEFIADFCKRKTFSGYQQRRNFEAPLDVLDVTAFSPMGCELIVSQEHPEAGGNDAIAARVQHQTGAYNGVLLTSGSNVSFADPGPATYLDSVRALELTGSATLPFPAAVVTSQLDYNLGGILWFQEINDASQNIPRVVNSLITGFGSQTQLLRVLNLPTGKKFRHSGGRFPYHNYTNHVLMPWVGSTFEPLGLGYNPAIPRYEWPQTAPPGFTRIVTDSEAGESWGLAVYFYSVQGALVNFSGDLVDQQVFNPFAGNPNGPGQSRSYVYTDLESLDWPAYGENITRSYSIPGTTRPQSVVYTQSGPSAGWSLSINGTGVPAGSGVSIPTPQLVPFPVNSLNGNTPFDQAAAVDIGFTTTTFTFSATGFSRTLTTSPITISLQNTARFFEFLVSFSHSGP